MELLEEQSLQIHHAKRPKRHKSKRRRAGRSHELTAVRGDEVEVKQVHQREAAMTRTLNITSNASEIFFRVGR